MAKTVREAKLESRAARSRLAVSQKPYYRLIDQGLHLGYRKNASGGKWVVRWYSGGQRYHVETLASADDVRDPDGLTVLSFSQAQLRARERALELSHSAAGMEVRKGPYTVRAAIEEYLAWVDHNRKSGKDSRTRAHAYILPSLGDAEIAKLTTPQLRKWLQTMAESPARIRSAKGNDQRHKELNSADAKRRRKATANRVFTILRAALNQAWREGKVGSDQAWRRVKPYPSVNAARVHYLLKDEAVQLIKGCSPEFRTLVQAALATGARYGELVASRSADFNRQSGTLHIHHSKTGPGRHVVLTEEGTELFTRLAHGKSASDAMFLRKDGNTWGKNHQTRPMREACKAANINPPISFHGLRHTYASLSVMNGVPLMVLAKNLGHSDTRMVEKHYGHLAASYIRDAIRNGAPRFPAS